MNPALVLRDALESDVPAITRIYGHHVLTGLATFEVVPPDALEIARRQREVTELGLPYLVTEVDGVVVGYAYASPYRPRIGYRFTVEDSIYLDPAYGRRGIGRALLSTLLESCEGMGFRQMVAVIGDRANAASIGLHEALGFTHAGAFNSIGFKFGRWVDTVLMQRPLGRGDSTLPAGP